MGTIINKIKSLNLPNSNNLNNKMYDPSKSFTIKKVESETIEVDDLESLKELIFSRDVDLTDNSYIYNPKLSEVEECGGRQAELSNDFKWLTDEQALEIIHSYFPDATTEDIELLYYRMRTCGCGYVAAINTLMDYYSDKPEEFEKIFGFKYSEVASAYSNGGTMTYNDVNYQYAFLDFFLYYNKEYKGFETIEDVYGNAEEERKYKLGDGALEKETFKKTGARGTYVDEVGRVFEDYCKEKGIELKVYSLTDTDYLALKLKLFQNKGLKATVAANDFNMYSTKDLDGNGILDDVVMEDVGSHAMTVVGTTDDPNKIIVSSWGEQYVIDKDEIEQYVLYEY